MGYVKCMVHITADTIIYCNKWVSDPVNFQAETGGTQTTGELSCKQVF